MKPTNKIILDALKKFDAQPKFPKKTHADKFFASLKQKDKDLMMRGLILQALVIVEQIEIPKWCAESLTSVLERMRRVLR